MANSLSLTCLQADNVAAASSQTTKQYLASFLNSSKQLAIRVYQFVLNVFIKIGQFAVQMKDKTVACLSRCFSNPCTKKIRALEAQLQAKNAEIQQLRANARQQQPVILPAAAPQAAQAPAPAQQPNDPDLAQAQLQLANAQLLIANLQGDLHQLRQGQNQQLQQALRDVNTLQAENQQLRAVNATLQPLQPQLQQALAQNAVANPLNVSGSGP